MAAAWVFHSKMQPFSTKKQAEAIEYAEALRQNKNLGEVVALHGTPTKKLMIINERRQLVETNL